MNGSDEYDDEHPWRHVDDGTEPDTGPWGHIDNEYARELVKYLHGPSVRGAPIRLKHLIATVDLAPTEIFWPVFLNTWPNCDHTWPYRLEVQRMLRHYAAQEPARNYMDPINVEFLDSLPPVVTAFRGCARSRIRGISWTLEESVARKFAGASSNEKQNRVLATARIPKDAVFAACIDRGECEIIVDPERLLRVWSVGFNYATKGLLLSIPPLNEEKV